jgi:hypothetical protein
MSTINSRISREALANSVWIANSAPVTVIGTRKSVTTLSLPPGLALALSCIQAISVSRTQPLVHSLGVARSNRTIGAHPTVVAHTDIIDFVTDSMAAAAVGTNFRSALGSRKPLLAPADMLGTQAVATARVVGSAVALVTLRASPSKITHTLGTNALAMHTRVVAGFDGAVEASPAFAAVTLGSHIVAHSVVVA